MAVRRFLREVGIPRGWDSDRILHQVEALSDIGVAAALAEVMQKRFDGQSDADPYPLLFASPAISIVTAGLVADQTEDFLTWLIDSVQIRGPVLDVGSGAGVSACFIAKYFPELEVVGIDSCREAIVCSTALAETLGLRNVRFEHKSLFEDPSRQYLTVIATTVARSADHAWNQLLTFSPYFTLVDIRRAVTNDTVPSAAALTAWAADEAQLVSVERIFTPQRLAAWWHALEKSGWLVDSNASMFITTGGHGGHQHNVPALTARRTSRPVRTRPEDLARWWCRQAGDEGLQSELTIDERAPLTAVVSWHLTTEDQSTVVQLLRGADGSMIGWSSSDSGGRTIIGLTDDPEEGDFVRKRRDLERRISDISGPGVAIRQMETTELVTNAPPTGN